MTSHAATTSRGLITVFGYGPTGQATVERLVARGQRVRVVQRRRPADLTAAVEFMAGDAGNADDVKRAFAGAEQVVITIGVEYRGKTWEMVWPKLMRNFLAVAEAANVRVVHIDNLYMYGAQDEALHEDMPLTSRGRKPAVRSLITRMWQKAAREGRVKWAALRPPDFYGPGVRVSHMGDTGLAAVAQGKTAMLMLSPNLPHAFAYVPDIGRAAVSLLDAPDDAFNQAWHVPCARAMTPKAMLQMGADAAGVKLKVMVLPHLMLRMMAPFSSMMREFAEMSFTWTRPYHVDATKFARRFWSDATPFEVGIPLTMRAYPTAASIETKISNKPTKPAETGKSGGQTPAQTPAG